MWEDDFEYSQPKITNPVPKFAVVILLGALIGGGIIWLWPMLLQARQDDIFPSLQHYLVNAGELATVKYGRSKLFDEERYCGFWGCTTAVCSVQGEVIAGVDLQLIGPDDVEELDENIVLTLPKPEILNPHNVIVEERSECFIFREGANFLLDRGDTYDLIQQLESEAQRFFLQDACEADILGKANKQAMAVLSAFFAATGFENVQIETQRGSCP